MRKQSINNENFIWGGLHPFMYHPFVFHHIPDLRNKKILDCGCGKGIYGYLIRVTRPLNNSEIIGLDIKEDYLEFCRIHNIYDKLIKGNIKKIPFKDKTIDLLICSEVVEHLKKKDSEIFFKEVDRVCKGRAIITTPNIFYQTYKEADADSHKSIWNVFEFRKMGYRVYGIGAKIVIDRHDRLFKLKQAISMIVTPLSYYIPSISGSLICVKDYKQNP